MQKSFDTLLILVLSITLFLGSCKSEQKKPEPAVDSNEMSPNLVKANELTETLFRYVELLETNQMTEAEANEKTEPVKQELVQLRLELTPDELKYNDSMRQVLGYQMVNKVMQWRKDNGLIKEEKQPR